MVPEEEKEVKDQEEKEEAEETAEEEQEEPVEQQTMELPPVNFENFIFGLYNTALFHLGVRDPESGRLIQNLPIARHTIDTLGMLQEKTRGNLTAPESNLLDNLLYELRMNYLRAARQPEEQPQEEPKAEEAAESESAETSDENN